ncbi:putative membrane protein YdjX (TVP38/TMEM64 family) [Caldalkalibacillus uzonensis]|uniref:TVP38/TMEM64 family membrane protein n=1 Tax=Caldalkalibacillus uzonensis TaxID=353224 RepID=A0ABU0CTR6_9BACI|nr:TVP38/TMEM64 family protein [Caldalkalibacillus uzonensis]MDQ0339818.1 putative membrane protein YdjX (TVP38/TMEM64 family) [Caldalkalibacillus uzonensis]
MWSIVIKKSVLKAAFMLILILFLIWINHRYLNWTPLSIREWIISFGWFAPVVFILLFTVRPLLLFPSSILTITAGLAFGPVLGTLYSLTGLMISAVVAFGVARKLGKEIVQKDWTGKFGKLQSQLEQKGFVYVLVLRLIPFINFDLISYLAGISKVHFRSFFYATLIGVIPGTYGYTFVGHILVERDPWQLIKLVLLFGVLIVIPLVFRKKLAGALGIFTDKIKKQGEGQEKRVDSQTNGHGHTVITGQENNDHTNSV